MEVMSNNISYQKRRKKNKTGKKETTEYIFKEEQGEKRKAAAG